MVFFFKYASQQVQIKDVWATSISCGVLYLSKLSNENNSNCFSLSFSLDLFQILKFNSVTQCVNSISHRSEGHKFVTKIYINENFENDFNGHLSCNLKISKR